MCIHRTIYERLANAFSDELQAIYQQRVDEIAPNLRYCAYNIGDETALQDLQKMRIEAGENQLSFKLDVSLWGRLFQIWVTFLFYLSFIMLQQIGRKESRKTEKHADIRV